MDAPRLDALARALAAGLPRRRLAQAVAALGLGGALLGRQARPVAARPIICPYGCEFQTGCCCDCQQRPPRGGVAGAGAVRTAEGEAHLSLVATQLPSGVRRGGVVVGFVAWFDRGWEGDGILVESVRIESYGPVEGVEGGREVRGWAYGGDGTEDPFVLRVVAHPDGDRAELWAGDAARAEWGTPVAGASGFAYHAAGEMPAGSLRLLSFEAAATAEGGTPEAGTPAA